MKLHAPLRTLALLVLAPTLGTWFPTASAQMPPPVPVKAPVELWWGTPTEPPEFYQDDFRYSDTGFSYLEIRGDETHEGVWVYLAGRPRVNPTFWTDLDVPAAYRGPAYSSLWDESYYDFNSSHLPVGSSYSPSILSQSDFESLITWAENGIPSSGDPDYPYNNKVMKKFQPLLENVTERLHDTQYFWWPQPGWARSYWRNLDIDQSSQILNYEAWMKKLITDQTGQDGIDWWYHAANEAAREHDLRLEIQVIMVYAEDDPGLPSDDNEQPRGPKGSYLAVGTSTPLEYSFAWTSRSDPPWDFGKPYPITNATGPQASLTMASPGEDVVFGATRVLLGATATLLVHPPGTGDDYFETVDLSHGPGLNEAVLTVPMNIPVGSWCELFSQSSPAPINGPIPLIHRDKIYIVP